MIKTGKIMFIETARLHLNLTNSTPGGDRDMHPLSFFAGNLILNNFCLTDFLI